MSMKDFWLSSGAMLLDRGEHGGLILTDAFLKAYLARPELMPPPEACDAERALHASLMQQPRRPVGKVEVDAIGDEDARENWSVMLEFRDLLMQAPTIEAAYVRLIRQGPGRIPPLFLNQLVHVILRNALEGIDDPFILRAAEIFFRHQRVAIENGRVMLADSEVIGLQEHKIHSAPLLAMFAGETAHMDVLTEDIAGQYWDRSDAFDMILDLGGLEGGRLALARVMERWVEHLLGISLSIRPVEEIMDDDVRWIMGLETEGTKIGNALWRGEPLEESAAERLLAIFVATARTPDIFIEKVQNRPIYLLLAMDEERQVRMKPQNFITGLPLKELALAH